jgi:hypothetical protein
MRRYIRTGAQGHNHEPNVGELTLRYRCFGSDSASFGCDSQDWTLIGDQVALNATFFAPTPETCDLTGALNGADAAHASSFWNCSAPGQTYQFQVFGSATGFSAASGPFTLSLFDNGCGFGQLSDGSFFNALYSPSRNLLTLYQMTPAVDRFPAQRVPSRGALATNPRAIASIPASSIASSGNHVMVSDQ